MNAPPLLALDGVEMAFGALSALAGVSFAVPKGSVFGLIGPNGAGKTTAFNCITGVYAPTRGAITFEGARIDGLPSHAVAARGVARTFQNIRLFGAMTVLENVLVASHRARRASLLDALLRTRRYHDDEARTRERALELLALFGLDGRADAPATSLSYGDQRRLEIARALALGPRLLLLDEPAAGMNSVEARALEQQIRTLRDRFELTVLLVEHNVPLVMGVCDTVHVIDRGESIAHGPPDEVRRAPRVLEAYLGTGEPAAATTRAPVATTDEPPLLVVESLEVYRGAIRAVKSISLEVHRGEIVALVGANGAGKTTTLKAIARLLPTRSGRVRFDGRDVAKTAPEALVAMGVALVPEGRGILPDLTVRENLELGAYTVRDRRVVAQRIERAVALFARLGERMKQRGGTLSGGEQQMLAIARALMSGPRLLLLDEPSLGIAPVLAEQVFAGIERVRAEGTTVLLVEQNTRRALAVSDRAYVIATGEVALGGRSADIALDPRVREAYVGAG